MRSALRHEDIGLAQLRTPDFAEAFGEPLSPFVADKIADMRLRFVELTEAERDFWLHRIVREVVEGDAPVAGAQRQVDWERGWAEHLAAATAPGADWRALVPRYFGKWPVVRWQGRLVKPMSPDFEYHMLEAVQWWAFDKWLREAENIYEFGCGTGHNLLRMRAVNPTAMLYGRDWTLASLELIAKCPLFDVATFLRRFDMFNPSGDLGPGAAVVTVAAMEQLGDDFHHFIRHLLRRPPAVVLHIEPIVELLDPTNLLDYLSLRYAEKRCYLCGLLSYLRAREADGDITIHMARRTGVGSLLLDGYQVICWSPK